MASLAERQTHILEQQNAAQSRPFVQPTEIRLTAIERFKKLGAPSFSGSPNPMEAEAWLRRVEQIFSVMEVSDEQRVALASFMLVEEAEYWWEATQRLLTASGTGGLTWNQFTKVFNDKYFPATYRYEKEREFLRLEQGDLTVAQYEAKFISLSRFAPSFVDDEEVKCRRFTDGLDLDIKSRIRVLGITNYSTLVDKALTAKKDVIEMKLVEQQKKRHLSSSHHENTSNRPSKRGGHGYGSVKSSSAYQKNREHPTLTQSISNQRHGQSSGTSSQFTRSVCKQCGRAHTGVCYAGTDLCFRCGQKGHLARYCTRTASSASTGVGSNKISGAGRGGSRGGGQVGTRFGKQNKGGVQSDRQTSQGRAFALTQRDTQANPEVVTGIIYVFSREAHVLIDPGSTHSFVSLSFSLHADKPIEPLGYCLSITTPIGDCVIIEEVYRGCLLQLGNREMVADLLPLEMLDFDLILGMDWLASYHASVDCYRKEVVFSNFGELEFRFCGD
ncbi:uncharacterized protein LOC114277904 [Camellia sinensis]|uniref:uncharacterized protein LOC114277904 n=1 Tax=Camellia sinensis TaxID=4442 RepID=UPI001036B800|nr:uncharacterized protein LOC114277904 [Camellia sinensis]